MIVTFPPDTVMQSPTFDASAAAEEDRRVIPGLAERFEPDCPGMHCSDTIDYGIMHEGEISDAGCDSSVPDLLAASYHGGRLATRASDSPHLLAPRIRAQVNVAGAIEDQTLPDDMKARLEAALTRADIDHKIENVSRQARMGASRHTRM